MAKTVGSWLEQNIYQSSIFSDIEELYRLKREQGLSVSLGLPTKNVSETLGPIITIIKTELQDNIPLLDQIAIIDSRSTDDTVSIAGKAGAEVYFEDELLPEAGVKKGKGEALWKSLAALKGDIVLWIDSDIRNIHPRFIYGLLGPLLINKDISFVKGFYERPIALGSTINKTGGGRVTEILARPLINLFYPELTGFIQPLSGEYGGRRELLESVPFYTSYAVELGLLIEIEKRFGLDSIAQVDLEERIHENQSTIALGRMSFAILQAFMNLIEEDKKISLKEKLPDDFFNVKVTDEGFVLASEEITTDKRPPIKEYKSYGNN